MKNYFNKLALTALVLVCITISCIAQPAESWKPQQLMEPALLAAIINNPSAAKPLIISIGPSGLIKGATDIGPANDKANLEELTILLAKQDKHRAIILYCGCCPFKNCPNIRPAFALLNSLQFKNHSLLNLPRNLKSDWIDKGYPMDISK